MFKCLLLFPLYFISWGPSSLPTAISFFGLSEFKYFLHPSRNSTSIEPITTNRIHSLPVTHNEEEILNEFLESSPMFIDCVTQFKGRITHSFTHLSHTYSVYHIKCKPSSESSLQSMFPGRECKWVGSDGFYASAVSTGMKKVFKLTQTEETNRGRKRGRTPADEVEGKQQQTLKHFFAREK